MEAGTVTLGALAPESDRALVVLAPTGSWRSGSGNAWIAPGSWSRTPGRRRRGAAVASCRPWPWMVVGASRSFRPGPAVLARHPVLVLWLGPAPSRLPRARSRLLTFLDAGGCGRPGPRRRGGGDAPGRRRGRPAPRGPHLPQRRAAGARLRPPGRIRPPLWTPSARRLGPGAVRHPAAAASRPRDRPGIAPVMKANAEALLLEDDPEKLEELRRHFAAKGFHPLAFRSASRAISAVRDGVYRPRPSSRSSTGT